MKKKIILFVLLIVLVGTASARDKLDGGGYFYDSWNEFYEYMKKASGLYRFASVYIDDDPELEGSSEVKASMTRENYTVFVFSPRNSNKCIYMTFSNSSWWMKGQIFLLPNEYNRAIKYWNFLLDEM